ncbi:MAG: hypothetical protein JWO51_3403 [Rhodospirillales bacterium]|nr:hypothetical protein [Rhodospirillales bacterium]
MDNPTANVLRGKIKRITSNPPYMLATIELDPKVSQEITISYVPVTPAPRESVGETSATPQPNVAPPPAQGDGVTVLVPVPNAVIMKGI